ncbi:MAG: type II toxin-antitoxin system VapC family toxin [Acidobacteriota bacterium]
MIFLDTSAIYALADRADGRHAEAKDLFEALLSEGEALLTHNYVLVESLALVDHRLGAAAAVRLARDSAGFEVVWVDSALHTEAVRLFSRRARHRVSFVDQVSFLVMKARAIDTVFAFDTDFSRQGFRLLGSPP